MVHRGSLPMNIKEVLLHAIGFKVKQSALEVDFYVFAIDGKTIAKQLGVRRMKWHAPSFKTEGFQRPLDMNRVNEISRYLSTNPPIMPNALVVAFERDTVEFEPLPNQQPSGAQWGSLKIRARLQDKDGQLVALPENERIGYVIDGQHRLRGIEESSVPEDGFPIIIAGFHNVDTKFQLGQFYTLNQTVPIPEALLALLRKELGIELRGKEAHLKAVSQVCDLLQKKPQSPFRPEVHVGSKIYKGPLSITVVQRMIDRATKATTLKYKWRPNANEIPAVDFEYVAQGLYVFWKAVSEVFSAYWGKPPKDQRLFSAIGLYTMIQFYDKVMERIDVNASNAVASARQRLNPISDLPWKKMQGLPSTPKSLFPALLFDAVNQLWEKDGKRPYRFKIVDPASGMPVVDVELVAG